MAEEIKSEKLKKIYYTHIDMIITNADKIIYTVGRLTPNGIDLLGTCFLIDRPGTYVTASHVTGNNEKDLVICFTPIDVNGYQDTSSNSVSYRCVRIEKIDPIHDICILTDGTGFRSNISISGTDNVSVSDKLTIVGYPHCVQGRHVLTHQEATVGAKILIANSDIKTKNIVINIQSRPGQSGSPVFRDLDSKLVAILIGSYAPKSSGGISLGGIDPQTLHQTTHAVSAEYILKMI